MIALRRLKHFLFLTVAGFGSTSVAYAEIVPQTYCRVKMCEVLAHCISNDCDAVECLDGGFDMELSSIGNQLNTFAVSPDKDSKFPLAGFEFDSELSTDDDIVASRTNDEEIAFIQVELHNGQPTDVTITTQTRGSLIEISVLHGHCGEGY
ncbi:hypothetical protein [uncultured Ruegeria sp.]|uniref:hypothetical protein n=1 Tax=uncultured Ruegeria sp. TaxID=259304 RepID=UPI002636430A|nr:hypothetical protein [uncultured Ruegeria sp.]